MSSGISLKRAYTVFPLAAPGGIPGGVGESELGGLSSPGLVSLELSDAMGHKQFISKQIGSDAIIALLRRCEQWGEFELRQVQRRPAALLAD